MVASACPVTQTLAAVASSRICPRDVSAEPQSQVTRPLGHATSICNLAPASWRHCWLGLMISHGGTPVCMVPCFGGGLRHGQSQPTPSEPLSTLLHLCIYRPGFCLSGFALDTRPSTACPQTKQLCHSGNKLNWKFALSHQSVSSSKMIQLIKILFLVSCLLFSVTDITKLRSQVK